MISFPFTSESGDRKVYTKDFRRLFKSYFTNGVFNGGFSVTPATGMKVNVSAGWCNIEGCFGYSEDTVEKSIETVSTETYFNIVLRLDDNKANRNIDIYVVKGTSSPAQLTRNSTVYELCIARIKVGASDTSITLDMIEDTRLKTDLCGIVASAVQTLETDTYYSQLQGALDKFIGIVQDALDETLAGNLQNQIDNYWKKIYPIGSVIETANLEFDPNVEFGGTWERTLKGKFPVGYDPDDNDFNKIGKTGGEKEHTLTVGEMPRHRHNGDGGPIMIAGGSGRNQIDNGSNAKYGFTDYQGNNEPHNNLPPYEVVAKWERTA